MKITLKSEHPTDEASAKSATGRTLGEWFAYLDARGGPAGGRRELGMHLANDLKLDPWWISTILIGYEAAHGLVEKDGRARGYTICATKSVKATPADCHAAFAEAGALDAWLGPKHVARIEDGGELSNADGNRALVKKVNPGKTLKLVWQQADAAPDTPVEIKFQPGGAKTTVMVTHERLQTRAEADGFRRAWGEALDRLKSVLERG
jgi:uncharacterized protein YndB with AHSA1/START domain